MFYKVTLADRIRIPPSLFSSNLKEGLILQIKDKYGGVIDKDLVMTAEQASVSHLIAMSSRIRPGSSAVNILTAEDL